MRTLYLDLGMGAAGDMLCSALMELLPNSDGFMTELNGLGIPGVVMSREPSVKCGIMGTYFTVKVNEVEEDEELHSHQNQCDQHHQNQNNFHCTHSHGHGHHGLSEIRHMVDRFAVSEKVKSDVMSVYDLIARAESHVHGVPVEQIHFHEVGSMDAVADITAVCLLMERLAPEEVIASPVHVGYGTVRCAHGILPVPAPATAYLLRNVPVYGGRIEGELCTPTGAALLCHFVDRFGEMPVMQVQNIGYGMGKKDFPKANCVRAMLGEGAGLTVGQDQPIRVEKNHEPGRTDRVVELNCNVDDMTGEEIGFAMEEFMSAGALDVFTTSIGMKKSRPGTMITVLCRENDRDPMVRQIFKHTTTLGIRENICHRYTLERSVHTLDTELGQIRRKESTGYGVTRAKYEYEDLARIAREQGMSLREIKKKLGL